MLNIRNIKLPTVDNPTNKLSGKRLLAVAICGFAAQLVLTAVYTTVYLIAHYSDYSTPEQMAEAFKDPNVLLNGSLYGFLAVMAIGAYLVRSQLGALCRTVTNYKAILIGLFMGFVVIGFGMLLTLILPIDQNANQALLYAEYRANPVMFFLTTALLAPIAEEIIYRIGLFGFLLKYGRPIAYIFSALIFAAVHIDFSSANIGAELMSLPGYLIPALALSFAYDKFGFWASTALHVTNNAFACIMIMVSI